jgi:hypothetical protein
MPNSDRGDRRAAKSTRKKAAPRKVKPADSSIFGPIGDAAAPVKRAQRQAKAKTERAQARVPRAPQPSIPVLKHPTPAQDRAATELVARSVRKAVAQAPASVKGAERSELGNQLLKEARAGGRGAPVRQASQRQQDSQALAALRAAEREAGRPMGGSKGQRVAAGHALLAAVANRAEAKPGQKKKSLSVGPATITPSALIHAGTAPLRRGEGIAAARFFGSDVPAFGGRALKDALGIPRNAVLGTVEMGKAGVDLTHGDSRRAKRIAGSLDDGPLGKLVLHGDVVGAAKSLNDAPVSGLLDFTGAGSLVGRGAGIGLRVAGRAGHEGNALARLGSTKRADLQIVEGTNQVEPRSYSKNAIVKAAQVAVEKSQRRRGLDPDVARPSRVPFKGQGAKMDAEVDEFAAQAEGVRRRGRDEMGAAAKSLRPKGKGRGKLEADVVFAAVERRLRGPETFEEDLRSERDRLQRVHTHEKMSPDAREANRAQVKAIDKVLGDPHALANAHEVFRAADEYTKAANKLEGERVDANLLDAKQAHIAKVRPYAIAKMGAKPMGDATSARLLAESGDRVGQMSVARVEAKVAARASVRVEKEAKLVRAYQIAKSTDGTPEQRVAARRMTVRLREDLGMTQDQVRRLAKKGVPDVDGAKRAAQVARDRAEGHRQSLSAREQDHADAVAQREEAKHDIEDAIARRDRAARARSEAIGAQRSQRARGAKVSDASRLRAERRLAQAKADLADAKKRAAAADRRAKDTHPGDRMSGLQDEHGNPLLTDDVVAHMERNGVPSPGFVSQRRDQAGARSHFVNWLNGRGTVDSKARTGEATRAGSYDTNYDALTDSLVRSKGQVDATKTFDDFLGRFGSEKPEGGSFTWDEAVLAAQERGAAPGGVKWVPVRRAPAKYDEARQADIAAGQDVSSGPNIEQFQVSRIVQATTPPEGKARQARNVVLVPERQLTRFTEHQKSGTSTTGKVGQAGTAAFRNTVLPFSTKWVFGNVAEAVLRSAVNGVTPVDFWRGGRVMKELKRLDEDAWRQMDVRVKGGLLFGSADKLRVRRAAEDFEGTSMETPAALATAARQLPIVKQTLDGLGAYQRGVQGLNRGLERAFQQGVIGKRARTEAQEIYGSWGKAVRMQRDVAEEVARGLVGTPKQVQFARYADEVLGKYGRFSPSTRKVVQTFAPFLPWFLNAARFALWTLPVKHPAKTALLTHVEQEFGKDWQEEHKNLPPGDLRLNPVRKDGGVVNVGRFTPFGAFTGGPETAADAVLPQISGFVSALNGRSFTGANLRYQDGSDPKSKAVALAFYSLVESSIPGVQLARRLQEHGNSAFDDSTVFAPKTKPGTSHGSSAANRVFNPLKPTYLKAGKSTSKTARPDPEMESLLQEARMAARDAAPSQAEQDELLREARLAAGG